MTSTVAVSLTVGSLTALFTLAGVVITGRISLANNPVQVNSQRAIASDARADDHVKEKRQLRRDAYAERRAKGVRCFRCAVAGPYATVMTTLPRACPCSTRRKPSAVSASG